MHNSRFKALVVHGNGRPAVCRRRIRALLLPENWWVLEDVDLIIFSGGKTNRLKTSEARILLGYWLEFCPEKYLDIPTRLDEDIANTADNAAKGLMLIKGLGLSQVEVWVASDLFHFERIKGHFEHFLEEYKLSYKLVVPKLQGTKSFDLLEMFLRPYSRHYKGGYGPLERFIEWKRMRNSRS